MKKKSLKTTIIIIVAVIVAVTGVFIGIFFTATKGNGETEPIETPSIIIPVIMPGGETTADPSEQPEVVEPKTIRYDISFEKNERNYYSAELSAEQQSVLLSYAAGEFPASLTAENDKKEEITMKYFLEYDADGVNYSDGYSDTGDGDYNVGFIFSRNESSDNSVSASSKTAVAMEFSLTAVTASIGVSSVDKNGVVTYVLTKANSTGTFSNGTEGGDMMLVWELSTSEKLPKFVNKLEGKKDNNGVKWKYSEMPCSYRIDVMKGYTEDTKDTGDINEIIDSTSYEGTYRQYKLDGSTMEFNVITYTNENKILSFIIYAPSPCTLVFNAN